MQQQETVQKLKAERVQKSVSKKKRLPLPDDPLGSKALHKAQDRLKAERVQERLKRLPGWKLQPGGQAIDRVLEFPDGVVAAAFASFAATLATRSGQGLRLSVQGGQVLLVLPGRPRRRGGAKVTEEMLDLAELLG